MGQFGGVPTDALDHVAFLSRSENRVLVMEALAVAPRTQRELRDRTGVPRTTLSRTLGALEDRGWITRVDGGRYELTTSGTHAVAVFRPALDGMAALCRLGALTAWLPTDELDIGLHHFREVRVRRPSANQPAEAGLYLASRLEEAQRFDALTFIAPPRPVAEVLWERTRSGALTVRTVFAAGLVEYLRVNPDGPVHWPALLDAGATVHRYDGRLPCNLFVVDDHVLFAQDRADVGDAGTVVESRNPTVRAWALDLVARYRDDAERLGPEAFG